VIFLLRHSHDLIFDMRFWFFTRVWIGGYERFTIGSMSVGWEALLVVVSRLVALWTCSRRILTWSWPFMITAVCR